MTQRMRFEILLALLLLACSAQAQISSVKTIFIILMENLNWSGIRSNAAAPYINNGLLPIQVSDTSKIAVGDELVVDLDSRVLKDTTSGLELPIIATDAAIEQMKRGGFLGLVRERLRQKLKAVPKQASS